MQRLVVCTDDGSTSIFMPELDEHYHSRYGAIRESQHVFIGAGLAYTASLITNIRVLELGFGTGLNAYLSFRFASENNLQLQYHAVEPFPLPPDIVSALNYPAMLGQPDGDPVFDQFHASPWTDIALVHRHFTLNRYNCTFQELQLPDRVDLVYFDAFAPRVQPELWSTDVFVKIFSLMNPGALLVTYCAKGEVKRNMRAAGFIVETLPGPKGKREMTRAVKPEI